MSFYFDLLFLAAQKCLPFFCLFFNVKKLERCLFFLLFLLLRLKILVIEYISHCFFANRCIYCCFMFIYIDSWTDFTFLLKKKMFNILMKSIVSSLIWKQKKCYMCGYFDIFIWHFLLVNLVFWICKIFSSVRWKKIKKIIENWFLNMVPEQEQE